MKDVLGSGNEKPRRDDALLYAYRFANIEYDEAEGSLRVAGEAISIEPRPLKLLSELLRRPNEVVSKDELLDWLWEGRPTVDNVLANAVNKLRKALGAEGAERIVNLPRVGYRLNGPIERVAVGQQVIAELRLKAGEPVPGSDGYRLERALGRSAGAEVWLARDVKLQVIRVFKFAIDSERLSALKREYTLYRVLRSELGERRDFARVVSANFATAPYFLECEYGGPDLLAWAEDGDRLAAMPLPERLALFLQIARAVAAAHGVGVLHKDLKPANVLVSSEAGAWVAKLTDFGSSRLLDPSRLAELGVTAMGLTITQRLGADSLSGTPLYLAPELLAGHAPSTQSDLYALGLMLYQMLTGDLRRPMSTGWQRDIDDELLRDDLTAATEGRLDQRLGSVAEWVERLTSLDERRLERSRRAAESLASAAARAALAKSRERRPWVIGGFISLALGLASSLWFYSRADAALSQAEQASTRAQAINDFLNKDVLQSPDVIRASTSRTDSMLDVLRRSSDRAAERFKSQPRTEASVRRQLGEVYLRLFHPKEADREFERALALLTPLVAANDPELSTLRFESAQCVLDRFDAAEGLRRLALAERLAGPAAVNGHDALALTAARARLDVMMDAQKNTEALAAAERVIALTDSLAASDAAMRFEARQRLGEIYVRLGDTPKAKALLNEIMAPPFGEDNVGEVLFARAKMQRGRDLINEGRFDEAQKLLVEVRDTLSLAFGPNELRVGMANSELADLEQSRGRFEEAKQAATASVEAFSTSLGNHHSYTIISKVNLALIQLDLGDWATALQALDTLRPQVAAEIRGSEGVVATIDFARARALTSAGRFADSLALLDRVPMDLLADGNWGPHDWQWRAMAERGRAQIGLGNTQAGQQLIATAVAEMKRIGSSPWQIAHYRGELRAKGPDTGHAMRNRATGEVHR